MLYRNSLRVASVLASIHAIMHQFGMMKSPTDKSEIALIESMRSYKADVMGSMRSYMDFYSGMGLFLTIMLISFGAILWQLSNADTKQRVATRPMLMIIGLAFLAFTAASVRYFFIAPIIMESLVAALVFIAYLKSRNVALQFVQVNAG